MKITLRLASATAYWFCHPATPYDQLVKHFGVAANDIYEATKWLDAHPEAIELAIARRLDGLEF